MVVSRTPPVESKNIMSHIQNEKWLEAALENFQDALDAGNYALIKDVIADTQEAGFLDEARVMNNKLRETPMSQFNIISPIQEKDLC